MFTFFSFLVFVLILPMILGYTVLMGIFFRKNIPFDIFRVAAFSLGLGIGIQTIFMFLLGWMGVNLGFIPTNIFLFLSVPVFMYTIFDRKKYGLLNFQKIESTFRIDISSLLAISILLISFFFIFFIPLNTPTYPDDALVNWNFRAKIIHETHSLNLDTPKDGRLFNGGTQQSYPLLVGLFKVHIANVIGIFDDRIINIVSPLFQLMTCFVLFGLLSSYFGYKFGFFAVILYNMIPLLWIHSINTYAEITAMFYILAAVVVIYEFFRSPSSSYHYIILSALLLMLVGWTKNEGIVAFFSAVFGAFLCSYFLLDFIGKQSRKDFQKSEIYGKLCTIGLFLGVYIGTILFWFIFRKFYGLSMGSGGAGVIQGKVLFQFHPEVFPALGTILFKFSGYSILPVIFIGSIFVFMKDILKDKAYIFILLSIFFSFMVFVIVFVFTENAGSPLNGDSRQLLMIMPIIFLFLSALFGEELSKNKSALI